MTTIAVVNRFLRLSAQEVYDVFKAYFITIDLGLGATEKITEIETAKTILDIPDKNSGKSIKFKESFVNQFNKTILNLHTEYEKENNIKYNVKNAAKLCLTNKSSVCTECNDVISAIESEVKSKSSKSAKAMIDYLDKSHLRLVKQYYNDISSRETINAAYCYKMSTKNSNVSSYISKINELDTKAYFGGSNITNHNARYEYVMMIDDRGLGEICIAWCKQYKIELQTTIAELGTIIRSIIADCSSNYNANNFGYQLRNQYLMSGKLADDKAKHPHCMIFIAYNEHENRLYFKHVSA